MSDNELSVKIKVEDLSKSREVAEVICLKAMSSDEATREDAQALVCSVSDETFERIQRGAIVLISACAYRTQGRRLT